jgi:bla regulator protein blaR1
MSFFGNLNFLQALGWAVLNSIWQMAFLWVILQVIFSFIPNRPAEKSRLASLFLGAGFVWFLCTFISNWLIDPNAITRSLVAMAALRPQSNSWNDILQMALPYASGLYLVLLIIPIFQFIRNYRFVQTIKSTGLAKSPIDLRMFVQRFAERMGIRKPVHLYISDLISSPVTIGFFKPIILMPIAAINSLSEKQVEAVLLHELAHIRRYDYLFNLCVHFIRTILYFNPFANFFARAIEREREKSCDDLVIQFQYDPHGYASALLTLEKNNVLRQSMALAAAGQKHDLLHRIETILGIEKNKRPDFRRLGGLLAGLACIVGLNAIFFLSSPAMKNDAIVFNGISNPFYQLVSDGKAEYNSTRPTRSVKLATQAVALKETGHSATRKIERFEEVNVVPDEHYVYNTSEPSGGFAPVDLRMHLEPQLKKYQEDQVKGTVAATKKMMEEGQWKQVEKNVADALTEVEKQNLRQQYDAELAQVNWNNLEEKLRQAYNVINWDKVNTELNNAITIIKLDSLNKVYSTALVDLDKAEDWMTENKTEAIPDTDLQLAEVKVQKQRLQIQLKTIKDIKDKKIIHL